MPTPEPLGLTLRRGRPALWARGGGRQAAALLGWGERWRAEASGPDRFEALDDAFRAYVARHTDALAFVTCTFAAESSARSALVVPEVVGRWSDGVLRADGPVPDPEPTEPADELDLLPGSLTRQGFCRAVTAALGHIAAGDVEKVVLARDLIARGERPVDLAAVLDRLQRSNPEAWTFHVDGLFGASPELLVARSGDECSSRVLAGSAPVVGDVERDDAAGAALAASPKDQAEHAYAARSVVERLATVADVTASDPYLLRLPTIQHLATDITGRVRDRRTALALAGLVHPSAAVCGTPTGAAQRLLATLEGFDRGRYAGPVGWMDARGDGEFAIALRCGQLADDGAAVRLFAGGGIVAGSDPSEELAETAQKFLPMYQALSPVARP